MSHLRAPGLGPIVGHTTATTTRLWIRGAARGDESDRTIGIAAIYQKGQKRPPKIDYFRLRREFDRTGIIDFTDLKPDQIYQAILGTLSISTVDPDAVMDDDTLRKLLPAPRMWLSELEALPVDQARALFRTGRGDTGGPLTFLFGSCRYPGLFPQQAKLADRIFAAMVAQLNQERPPDFCMMVGDQIYADLFSRFLPIGRADSYDEFRERYDSAFSTPNLRRLLQKLPAYMILDDHEIEDNWHQGRIRDSSKRLLFNTAIAAYRSYQWIHSPRNYGNHLYYSFEAQGYPFFVMDSRTQRVCVPEHPERNHLLGYAAKDSPYPDGGTHPRYPGQLDDLCLWLIETQRDCGDRPKFIVSPSVFVPNTVHSLQDAEDDDAWRAFPETRKTLLQTIVRHNIQNVVFLCGDVHCSIVASMSFHRGNETLPLKAYSITSSAFFWPFCFADGDPNSFVHNSHKERDDFDLGDCVMRYEASIFEQEDNFTRVEVDEKSVTVKILDRNGSLRGSKAGQNYSARLEL